MQLRHGMKVQGRSRTIPNKYTVTGEPRDNTYQRMDMRTTGKDATINARSALHIQGFWQRGGGGSGLTRQNLCHRIPKNTAHEIELLSCQKHHHNARVLSLRMDRHVDNDHVYADMIDAMDEHLIYLMAGGRNDLVSDLMRRELARGARHIIRRYSLLFREDTVASV